MSIKIYFGVPGSGKSTYAAKIVYKNLKKGIPTYSNVDIRGSVKIDAQKLGTFLIKDADIIIDEASIEFNNRAYKSLTREFIQWIKLYRHYGIHNIYVFSQSFDDMDITLRRLSDVMYIVKRSAIPGLIVTREISRRIGIDKDTHQIQDEFFFRNLGMSFTWGPRYWRMFDSWQAPDLPIRQTEINGFPHIPIHPDTLKLIASSARCKHGKKRPEDNQENT